MTSFANCKFILGLCCVDSLKWACTNMYWTRFHVRFFTDFSSIDFGRCFIIVKILIDLFLLWNLNEVLKCLLLDCLVEDLYIKFTILNLASFFIRKKLFFKYYVELTDLTWIFFFFFSFLLWNLQQLFVEAVCGRHMNSFYKIMSCYQCQPEPAYCGLSTLCIVLNALAIDPGKNCIGNSEIFNFFYFFF